MITIGFIDYYLDEWHANQYPKWIREVSQSEMAVTMAFGLIDAPHGRTNAQWCQDMGITLAQSIREVVENCDRLVVLSPDDCQMHEALCQLPLRSGKPTYVDKTFAPDYPTAKRIFDVADTFHTPCCSSSALRYAEEYQGIQNVQTISSWGPNEFETYAIHQLEPVMMLMQGKADRVMYIPGADSYTLIIAFTDGRTADIHGFLLGSPFTMQVSSHLGTKVLSAESDYFHHFICSMVDFFRDGRPMVSPSETMAIMAVRGAGAAAAQAPMTWIKVTYQP